MERSDAYLAVLLLALVATVGALLTGAGLALQVGLTVLVLAALLAYAGSLKRRREAVVETYGVDDVPEWYPDGDERDER
ncbi:MAG: hypothetical protein ABEJ61_03045 [Haloferacaceae archaeon]